MRIKVAINERYGRYGREKVILREIEATVPFTMFGYTFAAHPVVNPDGAFRDPKKCGWVVTEASSGAIAACGDLRRLAIENAKKGMLNIGEAGVRRAVNYALSTQQKGGMKYV
jgi:hypothetical protein